MLKFKIEKYVFVVLSVLTGLLIVRMKPSLMENSDHYFPLAISHDLLVAGGNLNEWVLMTAPRYFPDLLFTFISMFLYGDILRVYFISGVMLLTFQFFSIFIIGKALTQSSKLGICGAVGFFILAALHPEYLFVSQLPYHSGSFAVVIIILFLVLIDLHKRCLRKVIGILICLLTTLVVASDFLIVPFLLLGVFAGYAVFLLQKKRMPTKSEILRVGLVILSVIFGVAAYYFITPNYFNNPVNSSNFSLRRMLDASFLFGAIFSTIRALLFEQVAVIISLIMGLSALALLRTNKRQFQMQIFFLTFIVVNAMFNEFLMQSGAWPTDRYRIFTLNGSYTLIAISVCIIMSQFRVAPLVILGSFVIILFLVTKPFSEAIESDKLITLSDGVCVRDNVLELNLKVGATDPRTAQLLMAISNSDLKLIQISGKRKIRNWLIPLVNERDIDYVVSKDGLTEPKDVKNKGNTLEKLFGVGDEEILCGKYKLHVFNTARTL